MSLARFFVRRRPCRRRRFCRAPPFTTIGDLREDFFLLAVRRLFLLVAFRFPPFRLFFLLMLRPAVAVDRFLCPLCCRRRRRCRCFAGAKRLPPRRRRKTDDGQPVVLLLPPA